MEKIIKNTTFWKMIQENTILVPDYQRDYAQGREDSRIENIRTVFVNDLYSALKGEKVCHSGLVYGSFDDTNNRFIAVDGQQRLTTIFLFHWYLLWKNKKQQELQILKEKFKWQTREFSSQFVKLLFELGETNNIVTAITSHNNYFSIWENDPTVKGMLVMLKAIEKTHNDDLNVDILLSPNCKIQFDILKLSAGSDGTTYLKMNSRGRALTTFENFKAKFIERYKDSFDTKKMDDKWLDFMLRISSADNKFQDPDVNFMYYINEYAYTQHRLNQNETDEHKVLISSKKGEHDIDLPFISFENYIDAFGNDAKSFEQLTDWIVANYETIKNIYEQLRFVDDIFYLSEITTNNGKQKNTTTFAARAKFFTMIKFAQLSNYENVDELLFKRWTRVFRNLVENTTVDAGNLGNICRAIDSIDNSDIYVWLTQGNNLSAFDSAQVKEEIEKAHQIKKGQPREDVKSWEDVIINAESHAFFKGAIRFLFRNADGSVDWAQFDKKFETAKKYFDENGVRAEFRNGAKLTKILLSYCTNWEKQIQSWSGSNKYIFGQSASCWKNNILLKTVYSLPVHNLLLENDINENFKLTDSDSARDFSFKLLLQSDVLSNLNDSYYIRWFYKMFLYEAGASKSKKFRILSNKLLFDLWNSKKIEIDPQNRANNFLIGHTIKFKYNENFFQWHQLHYKHKFDIYLMQPDWSTYKNRPSSEQLSSKEKDNYYCFKVEPEIDEEKFCEALDKLISESKDSN